MNNILLAIGAGLLAVLYGDVMFPVLAALVPTVILVTLFTGTEGLSFEDLPQIACVVEVLLLVGTVICGFPTGSIIAAALLILVLTLQWLGSTPYPKLPPRR